MTDHTISFYRTTLTDIDEIDNLKSKVDLVGQFLTGHVFFSFVATYQLNTTTNLMTSILNKFVYRDFFITGSNIKKFIQEIKNKKILLAKEDLQSFNEFVTKYNSSIDEFLGDDTWFIINFN